MATVLLGGLLASLIGVLTPPPTTAAPGSGFDPEFPRVAVIKYTNCIPSCTDATATAFDLSVGPTLHFVDAPRRRVYAYRAVNTAAFPRGVAVIDADRLVQTAWINLSTLPSDNFVVTAFDPVRRRLYLGESNQTANCTTAVPPAGPCGDPGRLAVVDLTTTAPNPTTILLPRVTQLSAQTPPEPSEGDAVAGLAYDPKRDRVYVLTFAKTQFNLGFPLDPKGVSILAFDAKTLSAASKPLWTYRVRACDGPVSQKTGAPYFGVARDGTFVFFPCRGASGSAVPAGVPQQVTLHGIARVNVPDNTNASSPTEKFSTEFFPFAGDLTQGFSLGDPGSDRIGLGLASAGTQRLYVFDAKNRSWVASMLMGDKNIGGAAANPATGRIYILNDELGLRYIDAAALPAILGRSIPLDHKVSFTKDAAFDPITRRLYLPGPTFTRLGATGTVHPNAHLWVFEDRTEQYVPPPHRDPDLDTHDIEEKLAVQVSHGAGGSAYGARAMFVGGLNAVPFLGLVNQHEATAPFEAFKVKGGDRGLFIGQVNRAELSGEVDRGEAAASAVGARMDEATAADLKGKYGQLTGPAGIGGENSQPCDNENPTAQDCLAFDAVVGGVGQLRESTCSDFGGQDDPKDGRNAGSRVSCRRLDQVSASAGVERVQVPVSTKPVERFIGSPAEHLSGITIGESEAQVDLVKHASGGVTSTSKAVARGVEIAVAGAGALSIGEITSEAVTNAKGRPDSATSEFVARAKNVRIRDVEGVTLFSCGIQGADGKDGVGTDACELDNVATAINQYLAPRVVARGPRQDLDPDKVGFPVKEDAAAQAIIEKDPFAFWNDANVNGDSQREVSALDLTIYNDSDQASRLILQLAAVYSEAQYRIGNPKENVVIPPTKLTVDLKNKDGQPLAGGVFRVESGDILDLDAAPARTCVTTDDGVGNCVFDDLPAGAYSVTQTAAPSGYATGPPTPVTLLPGSHTRASFTNLRAVGHIVLGLADEGGEDRPPGPLAGGTFELSADNGDLRLGDGDRTVGSCTTDGDGVCGFEGVPLGAYVVHQVATPEGYLSADDIGFKLEEPEQTAALVFVVGLAPIEGTGGSSDAPPPVEEARETAFEDAPTDTSSVEISTPAQPVPRIRTAPYRERRGALERAVAAPSEALSFLARKPRQALLFVLMWVLLLAPVYLAVRRHTLIVAKGVV